jgi:RecA-family ATPase
MALEWKSAHSLLTMEFVTQEFVVPGVIPVGLTLLAGKPKVGKSWLSLDLAVAVANGGLALGKRPVERADVLYLALEDHWRRLQARLRQVIGDEDPPKGLRFITRGWPQGRSGPDALAKFCKEFSDTRFVIVDTLARVRNADQRSNKDNYQQDYEQLAPYQERAGDLDLAVMGVTHQRKSESEDWLMTIMGTVGTSGAVDNALLLERTRSDTRGELRGTGRELDDLEIALDFDKVRGQWLETGQGGGARMSQEALAVMRVMKLIPGPARVQDVADALTRSAKSTSAIMSRMTDKGQLKKLAQGTYTLNGYFQMTDD